MKLYAAMVVGLAIGAGIALVLSARELENAPPATTTTPPATPQSTPPAALVDPPTGA